MNVTVLGATGRTGHLVVSALLRRGHAVTAVVRDPARASASTMVVTGDVRDPGVLAAAVIGADAVVSALGPVGRDHDLHGRMAAALVPAMAAGGVRRYVGVSGAGMDAPGDLKRPRDRVVSWIMQAVGGAMVDDKAAELAVWHGTDLDWTLVRPPRLADGPATGRVEHDAHRSTRRTILTRADLADFVVDVLDDGLYVQQLPFVANR